jgi:hypothetical protein
MNHKEILTQQIKTYLFLARIMPLIVSKKHYLKQAKQCNVKLLLLNQDVTKSYRISS